MTRKTIFTFWYYLNFHFFTTDIFTFSRRLLYLQSWFLRFILYHYQTSLLDFMCFLVRRNYRFIYIIICLALWVDLYKTQYDFSSQVAVFLLRIVSYLFHSKYNCLFIGCSLLIAVAQCPTGYLLFTNLLITGLRKIIWWVSWWKTLRLMWYPSDRNRTTWC